MMKILIPLTQTKEVYHDNFFKAPHFGIYTIDNQKRDIYCQFESLVPNPYECIYTNDPTHCANHGMCDQTQCTVQHIEDHYAFSKSINGCNYVLADRYCDTMVEAFRQTGITLYKLSPFLHTVEIAIKNFILGVSLASTLQHIHVKS